MVVEVTDGVVNALHYYIDPVTGDVIPAKIQKSGGIARIPVTVDDLAVLLKDILKELQLLNLHVTVMTGEKFTKNDIGE